MNDVTINIHGGNNQILPNATQATQNFYGNDYIEKMAKSKKAKDIDSIDLTKVPLSHYINNVERLSYYTGKLATCDDARSLAQVVLEMCDDTEVKIDNEEMVKERFFSTLLPLAPKVKTGISNIRQRINDEAEKKFRHK